MKTHLHNGVHTPKRQNGMKRGVSNGLFTPTREVRLTSALSDVFTPSGTVAYRLYVGFVHDADQSVNSLALGVIDGLTDNTKFPALPYTVAQLTTLQQDYSDKMTASRSKGLDRTRAKNLAKKALTDAMVADALYCQSVARYDLDTLLSTGFDVCSKNRSRQPLSKPVINAITNGISGELIVRATSVLNAHSYNVQASTDGGKTWVDMDDVTGTRHISLTGLTPGTVYMVHIRAVGGAIGYSEWSEPMSHMVI